MEWKEEQSTIDVSVLHQKAIEQEQDDDDDDVKDNWDDSSEDEEAPVVAAPSPAPSTKASKLQEKIAEREAQRAKRLAQLRKEEQEATPKTAAEQLDEKQRILAEQKQSDLDAAREMFGVDNVVEQPAGRIDSCQPTNAEEFDELRLLLLDKIGKLQAEAAFDVFVKNLIEGLATYADPSDLKQLTAGMSALASVKEKASKAKKKGGIRGAKKLTMGKTDREELSRRNADDEMYADMDDFM